MSYNFHGLKLEMIFSSSQWVDIDHLLALIDRALMADLTVRNVRLQFNDELSNLYRKPVRYLHFLIDFGVVPLSELPFRNVVMKLRLFLTARDSSNSALLNRSGNASCNTHSELIQNNDSQLNGHYLLFELRDLISNVEYVYDQLRFDSVFEWQRQSAISTLPEDDGDPSSSTREPEIIGGVRRSLRTGPSRKRKVSSEEVQHMEET